MANEDTQDSEQVPPKPVRGGAGSRLKQARVAMDLSQEDVAGRLKIRVGLIDALEQEDNSKLPAPTYVCGYLRSYAKLLNISTDNIINDFPDLENAMQPVLAGQVAGVPMRDSQVSREKLVYAGVVVAVLIVAWLLLQLISVSDDAGTSATKADGRLAEKPQSPAPVSRGTKPDDPAQTGTGKRQPQGKDAAISLHAGEQSGPVMGSAIIEQSQPSAPDHPVDPVGSGRIADSMGQTTTSATDKLVVGKTVTYGQSRSAADNNQLASQGKVKGPTKGARTPASKQRLPKLELKFVGSSWAEVYDASGRRLIYEMGEAPTIRTITGKAPFEVILGFAPSVEVKYNAKSVDVTKGQDSVVVSLTIGKAADNPR